MIPGFPRGRRFPRRGRLAACVAVLLLLPTFGVAALVSSPASRVAVGPPLASGPVVVAPAYTAGPTVSVVGPVDPQLPLDVVVGLAPRDPAGLAAVTLMEYTPGSPTYHHFLSPSLIAARYGPSPSSVDSARRYFSADGVRVTVSPDRLVLVVQGPASALASSFHTHFEWYRTPDRLFYSHPVAATLPAGIPWSGALGLGNATPIRSLVTTPGSPPSLGQASCSSPSLFLPCQVRNAYNLTGFFNAGVNGSGYRIGVVDPYDANEPQGTLATDLKSFTAAYGLSVGRVHYLYPVPTSRDLNASHGGWGPEIALDLQWTRALAPGATLDMTFAPDASAGLYGAVDWLVAHQAVDVISLSWGESDVGVYNAYNGACASACNASSDGSYTLLHPVLADAAAEGIGVFVASGDCGAADGTSGVSTDYPSSDPSVTGVGATDLNLGKGGGYGSESGWSGNDSGARSPGCQNQGGSGGGYAPFPRPVWQRAPGLSNVSSRRAVPDVSILGGNFVVTYYNGVVSPAAGTSASAPMWAGIAAVADQRAGSALGWLTPALYAIARGVNYSTAFHDVRSGNNGYPAGLGWDPVTGLGSPNASSLLPLLVGGPRPPGNLSGTIHANPRFGGAPLTTTFYLNATGGSGRYPVYDVVFGDGNATLTNRTTTNHSYAYPGVYSVQSVVFDSDGNSSVAPPVAVVVGGGGSLNVSLTANSSTPAAGQSDPLTANASGGRAPYEFRWVLGDGTYLNWTNLTTVNHTYAEPGGYCAVVVVRDSASPLDGAASPRLAITVGGASSVRCDSPAPLRASLNSSLVAADLPGDLALRPTFGGGTPPVLVSYTSDDPYVAACQCAIFQSPGPHEIFAFANDSLGQQVIARLNVSLHPELTATFRASTTNGSAPLRVDFSAQSAGGWLPDDNLTRWNFGDSGSAVGQSASHVYAAPGEYLATASLSDRGHGNASEAFLIDVRTPATSSVPGLTGTVTPAVWGEAASPIRFDVAVTGRGGPFLVHWDLGNGGSAWGTVVNQSYPLRGCLANGTCPLRVTVNVSNSSGPVDSVALNLQSLLALRGNALTLADNVSTLAGVTPFSLTGDGRVGGVRGATLDWSYGDGATSTGPVGTHVYMRPGNYTLTETALDGFGGTYVHTHAVTVTGVPLPPPVLLGGPSTREGTIPLDVFFNVSGTGGSGPPYNYTWNFGDGAGGWGNSVNHVYRHVGLFDARVILTDSARSSAALNWTVGAYNLTRVDLTVGVAPPVVGPGAPVRVAVLAVAHCGASSLPPCASSNVKVEVFVSSGPGAILPLGVQPVYPLSPTGQTNVSVIAGTLPGRYTVTVCACTGGYAGSGNGSFEVVVPSTALFTLTPALGAILAGSAIAAVAAGLVVFYRRRRLRRKGDDSALDDA